MPPTASTFTSADRTYHSLANSGLPVRVRTVLEQVLRVASNELERRLDGMLVDFEQQLFRLADHARNPSIESGYLQTLRSLRLSRADLVPRFMLGLEDRLARIARPEPQAPMDGAATHGGLTPAIRTLALVDDSEVDADLLLRDLAQRCESSASLPLHLLGQRFGVLAAAPALDAERLPLGPYSLTRILQEASQPLQLPTESQHLLLRTFERKVMKDYGTFVELLNATLTGEGILPALTYVPLRVRSPVAQHADTAQTAPGQHGGERPSRRPTPISVSGAQPHTGWGPLYGQGDFDGGGAEDNALGALQELLNQRHRTQTDPSGGDGSTTGAGGGRQPGGGLPTTELLAALAQMRSPPLSPTGSPGTVGDIKRNVLTQLRQHGGNAATLSREDNDTFDLLGMLYERIEREVRTDTLAFALLRRLQLPLLHTALVDRGFFVRPQHPARQLLNTVAESGARWLDDNDLDQVVLAPLQRAVDHVVENAHKDPKAFEVSNLALQEELRRQARKAEIAERRQVQAARGKDKLEVAKQRAAEAIASLIGEQQPPKFARALIEQAWADVLTLTLLRQGEQSADWRRRLNITRRIVLACCGSVPTPDPELSREVETALTQVGYQADEASAISRRLTSARDDTDEAASQTELAAKLKSRGRFGSQNEEKLKFELPPRTAEEQAQYERVRVLPYGTWIEFVTNQQGDLVRKRLSWYSPITDNALFVNLRGQRAGDYTLDQLARMLARGQARIVTVERARLVDRAWQATLGALRSLASRNETEMAKDNP